MKDFSFIVCVARVVVKSWTENDRPSCTPPKLCLCVRLYRAGATRQSEVEISHRRSSMTEYER